MYTYGTCVCVWVYVPPAHMEKSESELEESMLSFHRESQGSKIGHQAWGQESLPAEPSYQLSIGHY